MPLELTNQMPPQETLPSTATDRDLTPDPLPEVTAVNSDSSLELPDIPLTPTGIDNTYFSSTPDYGILEGITAGWRDTSINAFMNGTDEPDFEYDSTFNPAAAIKRLQDMGRSLPDSDIEKLMKVGSNDEFEHQMMRLDERNSQAEVSQDELLGYVLGSLADADTLVPMGLGKLNTVRKMGNVGRAATVAAGTAGMSYSGYTADTYTPLSGADIAFQVSIMTAAGAFPELLRGVKLSKQANGTPNPKTPDNGPIDVQAKVDEFNPSGVIEDVADELDASSKLERGDLTDITDDAELLADADGIQYYREGDNYFAVQGGETVGELTVSGGEANVMVLPEMRGKGVGKNLGKYFFKGNPEGVTAGSYTTAGKATAEAALREINNELK